MSSPEEPWWATPAPPRKPLTPRPESGVPPTVEPPPALPVPPPGLPSPYAPPSPAMPPPPPGTAPAWAMSPPAVPIRAQPVAGGFLLGAAVLAVIGVLLPWERVSVRAASDSDPFGGLVTTPEGFSQVVRGQHLTGGVCALLLALGLGALGVVVLRGGNKVAARLVGILVSITLALAAGFEGLYLANRNARLPNGFLALHVEGHVAAGPYLVILAGVFGVAASLVVKEARVPPPPPPPYGS